MKTKSTHPWRRDKIGKAISTMAARAKALADVRRRAMEFAIGGHLTPKGPMKKSTKPEVKKTTSPKKIKLIREGGAREEVSRGTWMPVASTVKINDLLFSLKVDKRGQLWLKIHA